MTRDDWCYLAGAALVTAGASAIYWPAGFVVAGLLVLVPRVAEWVYVLRNTDKGAD